MGNLAQQPMNYNNTNYIAASRAILSPHSQEQTTKTAMHWPILSILVNKITLTHGLRGN